MRRAEWSGLRQTKPTTTTPSGVRGCDEEGGGGSGGGRGAWKGEEEMGGGRIRTRMEERLGLGLGLGLGWEASIGREWEVLE